MPKNKIFFIFSSALVFFYLILRAIYVPLAHDEAATFFHYITVGDFLPYQSIFDANNHLLNSLLEYISFKVFGTDEVWLRLPNLLSFVVYAFYLYKVSLFIKNGFVRDIFQIALLCTISIIEFFALSRGYGLSIAFFMAWFYYIALFLKSFQLRHQILLWIFALLALSSNLSLLNSYLLTLLLVVIAIVYHWKTSKQKLSQLSILLLIGVPIFMLGSSYAFDLKNNGALYLGSLNGFIDVTVMSLMHLQFNLESLTIAYIVALLVLATVLILMFVTKSFNNHIGVVLVLLLGNLLGAYLLAEFFNVNYPENRAGIYFVPLTIFSFAFLCDQLHTMNIHLKLKYISLLLVLFPLNLLANLNLNIVRLWPGESISNELYSKLLLESKSRIETTIGGYNIFQITYAYKNREAGTPLNLMTTRGYPDFTCDFNIIREQYLDSALIDYDLIYSQTYNDVHLIKRKEFLNKRILLDTSVNISTSEYSGEYFDLLRVNTKIFHKKNIIIEIPLTLNSFHEPMQCNLIISIDSKENGNLVYEWLPLHWYFNEWDNKSFTISRSITNFPENAENMVVYIWNTGEVSYTVKVENIKIYELN